MHMGGVIEASVLPNLSSMLGSSGHQALLNAVSNDWGGNTVFGTENDPFREKYQNQFINTITAGAKSATNQITETWQRLFGQIEFVAPVSPEDLPKLPYEQLPHIMTDPDISHMHGQNQIYGFGYDSNVIGEMEDTAGRLISNGTFNSADELQKNDGPVEMKWHWTSADPDWGPEDIEAVEQARTYIKDQFLAEFMGSGESVDKDPTAVQYFRQVPSSEDENE